MQRAAAHRIACAVVAAEVGRIRETDLPDAGSDWPEDRAIGDEGLGLDSLERLGAIGALAETFGLDDALLGGTPPRSVGDWTNWILRHHATGGGRLTVHTSGSKGRPRPCVHALADLLGEAAWLGARFADRRRVVAMVPAHHLYGMIWTALLPGALGVPVVVRTIGVALDLAAGDLVVAVPDQWQAMLRLVRRFPADVIGVTSGGPIDDAIAAELRTAGLSRLIDIYGSSETSGIAVRDVPAAGYDLLPRWRLVPLDDSDWQLADGSGVIFPLPDHVERLADRMLRPVRRRDGAVQVAGHNVWPERVAEVLRGVDGVADVAVRLHVNGRLKAFVVPDAGQDVAELSRALDQAIAAQLTAPERPKNIRFGAALPRNAMGKLQDW